MRVYNFFPVFLCTLVCVQIYRGALIYNFSVTRAYLCVCACVCMYSVNNVALVIHSLREYVVA